MSVGLRRPGRVDPGPRPEHLRHREGVPGQPVGPVNQPGPLARGPQAFDRGSAPFVDDDAAVPEMARRCRLHRVRLQVRKELPHVEAAVLVVGHVGWKPFLHGEFQDVLGEVGQREIGAVVGAAPPLQDLDHRGHRVHVAGGSLHAFGVPLRHVPLAGSIQRVGVEVRRQQVVDAVNRLGVDEDVRQEHGELHVHQLGPHPVRGGQTVTGQLLGRGGELVHPHGPARAEHRRLRLDDRERAGVQIHAHRADHPATVGQEVGEHEVLHQPDRSPLDLPGEDPAELDPRDPDPARVPMARRVGQPVDPGPPVDDLLRSLGRLADVDLHQPLIRRVVALHDHVLEEGLFAVPPVPGKAEHVDAGVAVHVDVSVRGEGRQ